MRTGTFITRSPAVNDPLFYSRLLGAVKMCALISQVSFMESGVRRKVERGGKREGGKIRKDVRFPRR